MITLFFILKWAVIVALAIVLVQFLIPLLWIGLILCLTAMMAVGGAVFYSVAIVLDFLGKVWRKWTR
jgi:hypothetical protein